MKEFLSHPLVADHKGTDMQSWYTRLRIYLNQLFHGDNVLAGPGIYKESTTTGYTLSSMQVYILENDVSTAATALAAKDLTGLVWEVTAESKYLFTYIGNVSPNLASTGCGFSLSLGGASGTISMGFHHKSGTGDTGGGSSISDGGVLNTSASFPGTGNYPIIGHGTVDITGSLPATIQLRIHPEANDVVIARAGFALIVTRITEDTTSGAGLGSSGGGHIGVGGTVQHPAFTTTVAGFVPAPGSVAGEFLSDDGSWASVFTGLPLGTASPLPQEVIVKQSGVWVRLAWADFLTAINSVGSASLDFSQASNSQYIGAVHI